MSKDTILLEKSAVFIAYQAVTEPTNNRNIELNFRFNGSFSQKETSLLQKLIRKDFLINKKIIEKKWQLKGEGGLDAQEYYGNNSSHLEYENGLIFDAFPDRLSITDLKPENEKHFNNLVKNLYKLIIENGIKPFALGLNFILCKQTDNAGLEFQNKYLQDVFSEMGFKIEKHNLQTSFDISPDKSLHLKILNLEKENIFAKEKLSKQECVLYHANFHYVIDGQENLDIPQEIAVLDNNIEKIKKII